MAEVRKIECEMNKATDFAPSEMYLVVLTEADAQNVCDYAHNIDSDKQLALQSIINGSLYFLRELLH